MIGTWVTMRRKWTDVGQIVYGMNKSRKLIYNIMSIVNNIVLYTGNLLKV
jgi:hypothetical protein